MSIEHKPSEVAIPRTACAEVVPQGAFGFRNSLTEDFVRLAQNFDSAICVEWIPRSEIGKGRANGKDPEEMRLLKTRQDKPVWIHATGSDAQHAVEHLGRLVENRPGSEYWTVSRDVIIRNNLGIHARPAARIVKTAMAFTCNIIIESLGRPVNCKSIMGILSLAAGHGTRVTFRAIGRDAGEAVDALTDLVNNMLGEAE